MQCTRSHGRWTSHEASLRFIASSPSLIVRRSLYGCRLSATEVFRSPRRCPRVWNELPHHVTSVPSPSSLLKTHLFSRSFSNFLKCLWSDFLSLSDTIIAFVIYLLNYLQVLSPIIAEGKQLCVHSFVFKDVTRIQHTATQQRWIGYIPLTIFSSAVILVSFFVWAIFLFSFYERKQHWDRRRRRQVDWWGE